MVEALREDLGGPSVEHVDRLTHRDPRIGEQADRRRVELVVLGERVGLHVLVELDDRAQRHELSRCRRNIELIDHRGVEAELA